MPIHLTTEVASVLGKLVNKYNLSEKFENTPLGFVHINSLKKKKLFKAESLEFQKIRKVETYRKDLLLLTEDGHLYYREKLLMKEVKDVFVSPLEEFFFALNNSGDIFSMGENYVGQLGLGTITKKDCLTKIYSLVNENVCQITIGGAHVLCLTTSGKVYGWGGSWDGQIIANVYGQLNNPKQIDFFNDKNIVQISAGDIYSLALTRDGNVYAWGNNYDGQLGLGHNTKEKAIKIIDFFVDKNVAKIATGDSHSLALTKDGKVYSWGNNEWGQLGVGNKINQFSPRQINSLKKEKIVDIISAGAISVATTESRNVYSWGWNIDGQLGLGDTKDRYTPTLVLDLKLS